MKYTSINIQGNLISEEILQKIEEADVQGQLAKDFGFEPGINLRSEIEYAWSRIKLDWKHFSERMEKLPPSDPYGTTLARKWMVGFFNTLGFEISLQKTSLQGDNDRQYTISHTCNQLDGLPVHIAGFYDPNNPQKNTLDIRSSGGTTRMSPHATVQEYLNVTEHLYAMVTNGMLLRLVRDSGHLVKLTYIEFDLKRLLDEDKYSEFTLLYRLLHASRFPKSKQETEDSLLEKYYQDSIESGNRIRDGLSGAVKQSLIALGNGLLEHPENAELREKVISGRPDARDFYHQLLRLIYRLLFLMVTEERDLIFSEIQDDNQAPDMDDLLNGIKHPTRKQKEIYYQYYSLIRLRKLSEKRYLQENQYTDLWQGLLQTFTLFESGGNGKRLGILALGSELFSGNAMPDITSSRINNKVLLQCIRSLNEFEDERHNLSFINYRALDVEELGSVYEGLLELEPVFETENEKPKFTFRKGSERSSSGSHYTPEDLVKPLIQHSLEYLIEERVENFYKEKSSQAETKKKLLDLKVCDVACGSGHILLSAARRIALEVARVETGEQQPNPTSFRHALKEVIRNCIYGVDKNPLAVELCKVALWLESHNPGEPLSFLDHRIKCGDAIVGLAHKEELQNGIANEAYKKLPGDDKEMVSTYLKKNKQERTLREKSRQAVQLTTETDHKLMQQVKELNEAIEHFSELPENTPDEIDQKEKAYRKLITTETLRRLKILADLQIMPFFLEKKETNKEFLISDAQYHRYLRGELRTPFNLEVKAIETATINRFFHWFLEFPEVFQNGGFDCILGNPPFLGGGKISTFYGKEYLNYVQKYFEPIGGQCDLVGYFFRRNFSVINNSGFISLISTNTISQGDTREGSLDQIISGKGYINYANKSTKWPGRAAVYVALVTINKRGKTNNYLVNTKVQYINSFLEDNIQEKIPKELYQNQMKGFLGSGPVGNGFLISNPLAAKLRQDKRNTKVVKPYLTGEDLNKTPEQASSRHAIYFYDWEIEEAMKYEECFEIVLRDVKPERETNKDKHRREFWWQFSRPTVELYNIINSNQFNKVIVQARVSKTHAIEFVDANIIFSDALVVFAFDDFKNFAILQSSIHEIWSWKYSSTLKGDRRYAPSDCFETYPFPKNTDEIAFDEVIKVGIKFQMARKSLMKSINFGLTKTYNLFHNRELSKKISSQLLTAMDKKMIQSSFGKDVWLFWDYYIKNEGLFLFDEIINQIQELRELHIKMDNSVLDAYGWQDIELKHDYYEVDYLPENDRIRFTINPDARKEILKRLLELNHKIHEEEVKAGLWDKKSRKKKTTKSKTKANQVNEGEVGYGGLFG
jgi:hypothetical protein